MHRSDRRDSPSVRQGTGGEVPVAALNNRKSASLQYGPPPPPPNSTATASPESVSGASPSNNKRPAAVTGMNGPVDGKVAATPSFDADLSESDEGDEDEDGSEVITRIC